VSVFLPWVKNSFIKLGLEAFKGDIFPLYRMIKKDGLNWTVNGASPHARQLVPIFQVFCSLYGLTCVGYAQNFLEFVSRSPLIHVVGRSIRLYTDSLFAQIGDSNDKCSSLLKVDCWNEDETHPAVQRAFRFNELTHAKNLVLHSSHFALNWRYCTVVHWTSVLAMVFENLGSTLSNVM